MRPVVMSQSTYGHTGPAGASMYSASKHAVESLTKSAALEAAASGVRVNLVAPGPIETGMLSCFTGTDERKAGLDRAAQTSRKTRRDRSDHNLSRVRQDVVHHGCVVPHGHRQNGPVMFPGSAL